MASVVLTSQRATLWECLYDLSSSLLLQQEEQEHKRLYYDLRGSAPLFLSENLLQEMTSLDHGAPVEAISFHPSGKFATACIDH